MPNNTSPYSITDNYRNYFPLLTFYEEQHENNSLLKFQKFSVLRRNELRKSMFRFFFYYFQTLIYFSLMLSPFYILYHFYFQNNNIYFNNSLYYVYDLLVLLLSFLHSLMFTFIVIYPYFSHYLPHNNTNSRYAFDQSIHTRKLILVTLIFIVAFWHLIVATILWALFFTNTHESKNISDYENANYASSGNENSIFNKNNYLCKNIINCNYATWDDLLFWLLFPTLFGFISVSSSFGVFWLYFDYFDQTLIPRTNRNNRNGRSNNHHNKNKGKRHKGSGPLSGSSSKRSKLSKNDPTYDSAYVELPGKPLGKGSYDIEYDNRNSNINHHNDIHTVSNSDDDDDGGGGYSHDDDDSLESDTLLDHSDESDEKAEYQPPTNATPMGESNRKHTNSNTTNKTDGSNGTNATNVTNALNVENIENRQTNFGSVIVHYSDDETTSQSQSQSQQSQQSKTNSRNVSAKQKNVKKNGKSFKKNSRNTNKNKKKIKISYTNSNSKQNQRNSNNNNNHNSNNGNPRHITSGYDKESLNAPGSSSSGVFLEPNYLWLIYYCLLFYFYLLFCLTIMYFVGILQLDYIEDYWQFYYFVLLILSNIVIKYPLKHIAIKLDNIRSHILFYKMQQASRQRAHAVGIGNRSGVGVGVGGAVEDNLNISAASNALRFPMISMELLVEYLCSFIYFRFFRELVTIYFPMSFGVFFINIIPHLIVEFVWKIWITNSIHYFELSNMISTFFRNCCGVYDDSRTPSNVMYHSMKNKNSHVLGSPKHNKLKLRNEFGSAIDSQMAVQLRLRKVKHSNHIGFCNFWWIWDDSTMKQWNMRCIVDINIRCQVSIVTGIWNGIMLALLYNSNVAIDTWGKKRIDNAHIYNLIAVLFDIIGFGMVFVIYWKKWNINCWKIFYVIFQCNRKILMFALSCIAAYSCVFFQMFSN